MKKTLLIFAVLAIVLLSSIPSGAVDGWATGNVVSVRDQSNRTLVVVTSMLNPAGCTYSSYLSLDQDGSEKNRRLRQDILLSYIHGTPIQIGLTGCSSGNYPNITEVWLK